MVGGVTGKNLPGLIKLFKIDPLSDEVSTYQVNKYIT